MTLMLLTWGMSGYAQTLGDYQFSTGTDTTKWINLSTTTSILNGTGNGVASALQNIGFAFGYAGNAYAQFSVNSDGNLRLGGTVTGTGGYGTPFGSTNCNTNAPKINFFGCDGFLTDSGYVYTELIGTAPNRVRVIEFATSTYNSTSRAALCHWQVQLFEGSNNIQVVYSTPPVILPNVTRQEGMCVDATDILLVNSSHQMTHYSAATSDNIASGTWPDLNRYYLFTAPPMCISIAGLTATQVTTTSVSLAFEAPNDQSSWQVTYFPVEDSTAVNTVTVNTTTPTLTGLTPNTLYSITVTSTCPNGEESNPMTVLALTLLTDAATLPYLCDFEDAAENANWAFYNGDAANQWVIGNGTGMGGGQSLYISNDGQHNAYYYDSASVVFAVRDVYFDPNYDYYTVNFKYKSEGLQNSDYLRLYIGRSPSYVIPNTTGTLTGPSNAIYLTIDGNGSLGQTPDWRDVNLTLDTAWRGHTARFYLAWVNNSINGLNPPAAIDQIRVTGHTCVRPYNVHYSYPDATSMTLSWSDSVGASGYEVALLPFYGGDAETAAISVTDTFYTFTNMASNTPHRFYLRSVCGSEKSSWATYNMGVRCAPISTLPYEEHFDVYGTGSTAHPTCWFDTTNYTTAYPYVSNTNRASGIGALYFYSTSTSFSYAVMPQIDVDVLNVNEMMLSLKALKTLANYGRFDVGVMTDPYDLTTFTLIKSFYKDDYSGTSTWNEFNVYFNNYTGSGSYIAIRTPNEGSSASYVYIDDVVLKALPDCYEPYGLTASNVNHEGFRLDWSVVDPAPAYDVALVSPAGAAMETAVITTVSGVHATLNGLTENTNYQVFVRSNCGASTSEWSAPISVSTRCLPANELPYTEGFEGTGGSGAAYFPDCWVRHTNNTTNYPYVSTTQHAEGTSALYFYSTTSTYSLAVSQGIDLSQAGGETLLSFKLYKTSAAYGRMDIGLMTDPDNMNTFQLLQSIYPGDLPSTSTWYDFQVVVPEQSGNVHLAFYTPQGVTSYVYLDAVKLETVQCSSPTNLTISNVAGTSAMVSWNAAPIAVSEYTLEYSESEQDAWTPVITNETSLMLTGLDQGTAYEVRIFSNCLEGNSDTLTASFSTLSYMSCTSPDTIGTTITDSATATTTYYVPVNNLYRYTYSQQIYTANEINPSHTPTVITALAFQFNYATAMTKKTDVDIYLAHRTDSTFSSTTNWTPISDAQLVYHGDLNCAQGWNVFQLDDFFSYNGVDNLVVIVDDNSNDYNSSSYVFNAHTKSNSVLYIRSDSQNYDPANPGTGATYNTRPNIRFYTCDQVVPMTCVAPNLYDYSASDQSITLSWAPGLNETSWEIRYKAESDTDWNTTTATSSPFTLDNLTPATTYTVELRSDCGGEYSDWTGFTVSTVCEFVSVPFTEDFEGATGTSYASFVDCWSRGTNHSSSYPYVSSSQSVSGSNSLYFYGSSSYYCYAATPRFADDVQMDSLQITFQARKSTASYYVEVGVMSDPTDFSTFQLLGSFTPSATNTWEESEFLTTGYTGSGRHIAFRIPKWTDSYMYVDDIHVDYIPSCLHVENIYATSITTDSATVTWTAGGDETSWLYAFGPAGTLNADYLEDGDYQSVSENTLVFGGLEGNTPYDLLIKADCGDETSTPMLFSFRTECVTINTLPYIENFDSWGSTSSSTAASPGPMPACWERINTYSAPRPFCNSTYHYDGVAGLYFYATGSTYNVAVCPELGDGMELADLQVQFMYRTYSSSYNSSLIVGVMTSQNDLGSFVPVDTITTNTTDWHQAYVQFGNYTGNGKFIALKFAPTSTDYFMIDNFMIDAAPACDAPADLAVGTLTSTSATFNWTDDGSGSWQVIFVPSAVTNPDFSQAETVSSNSYTAEGLANNTNYTFYVRTVCPGGQGFSNWTSVSCRTLWADPAVLPYFHDFENADENASWRLVNGTYANKWYIGIPTGESDSVLFASQDGTTTNYNITSASYVWAYRDFILPDAAGYKLSFNWKNVGEHNYDYIRVYIGEPFDVSAGSTIPTGAVQLGATLDNDSTWQHFEADITSEHANTTRRIYIHWRNDSSSGSAPAAVIDSIALEAVTCGMPYDLTLDAVTTTSATVSFTPASTSDNAWEYVIGDNNFVPSDTMTEVPQAIQSTTFDITSLTENTRYTVYVRTSCGSGEYSNWSAAIAFKTACDAITVPYTMNFDNMGTGTTAFPDCWTRFNTYSTSTNYPYISSTYATSGNASLYFYNSSTTYSVGVLPLIDVSVNPVNTLQISFKMRPGALTNKIVVGVMTNPEDFSTFVPIDTAVNSAATTFEYHEVMLNSYTGNGAYVALRMLNEGTTYTMYVDDILLEEIPSCLRPTAVVSSAPTTTSITLDWTPGGSETSWEIAYGTNGFDPDAASANVVTANTHPFTVTGLSSSSMYQFYVRALCSATDQSQWSLPTNAATDCDVATLPYSENFDSYAGTTYTDANGIAPACWTTEGVNSYGGPHIIGSGNYHYADSLNSLIFTCNTTTPNKYAALPTFDQPLNTLHLNFWRAMESTSSGTLTVGYVTNLNDLAGTFTAVATIPSVSSSNGDTISVDFTGANIPANGNICFHWYKNGSFFSCCIDNVNVTSNSSVTNPTVATNAATAVAQTTATLNGTITNPDNVTISAKGFQWKTTTGGTYQTVNATGSGLSYNLTGLTANTGYTFRAFITFNGQTVYGDEMTFTTLEQGVEPCDVPTGVTATNITGEGATITWDANANVSSWNIQYGPQGGQLTSATTSTNSYVITGLTPSTTYNVQVQAVCDGNNASDWSAIYSFTTTTGIHSWLENSVKVFPNPANDFVNVQCTMYNVQFGADLHVFDVYGKLVQTVPMTGETTAINVSSLADGMYFVRVTTEAGTVTKPFVVKR